MRLIIVLLTGLIVLKVPVISITIITEIVINITIVILTSFFVFKVPVLPSSPQSPPQSSISSSPHCAGSAITVKIPIRHNHHCWPTSWLTLSSAPSSLWWFYHHHHQHHHHHCDAMWYPRCQTLASSWLSLELLVVLSWPTSCLLFATSFSSGEGSFFSFNLWRRNHGILLSCFGPKSCLSFLSEEIQISQGGF